MSYFRVASVATTFFALVLIASAAPDGQRNQKDDGQRNQKDDGQQNQNGDVKKAAPLKNAELKAQPGKFDFGWFAPKAKGNVLQNNQLEKGKLEKGKGKGNKESDGQNNQNDDGQKNQKNDGQKNQKG